MLMRTLTSLHRRLDDEGGFTLVEALVALTILAVGSFAAAQALSFGLTASGMSRERLAARSAVDQQMELARALNYDNLVLDDSAALTHSADTTDPDYWVDETAQTFDPDGTGPLDAESIVRIPGQSPAFHHIQTPIVQGDTTFAIYVYVTWVDSPSDGTVAAGDDQADGNGNGIDDSNGHDQKRVTVAVTWIDPVRSITMNTTQSSLFSDEQIPYHQPAHNNPPTVSCPQVTAVNNLQFTFTPIASDSDGTITTVIWSFSDSSGSVISTQSTAFTDLTYTFPAGGTYGIVNTVVDNGSANATNSGLSCSVTAVDPADGNGGPDGGANAIQILSNAPYTNLLNVTLNLSYPNGANGATQMQFSNDGVTWSAKQAVSSSTIWTLVSGDGVKTVWVRYWNSSGLFGKIRSDSITLDQTKPSAPTSLTGSVVSTNGSNHTVSLSWGVSTDSGSGLAGYRLWRRLTTSSTWAQVSCSSGTSCSTTVKASDSYVYYVEAYDNAGNTSAQSNTFTI